MSLPEGSVDHEVHQPVAGVRFAAQVSKFERIVVVWNDSLSIKGRGVGVTGKGSGDDWSSSVAQGDLKECFTFSM